MDGYSKKQIELLEPINHETNSSHRYTITKEAYSAKIAACLARQSGSKAFKISFWTPNDFHLKSSYLFDAGPN